MQAIDTLHFPYLNCYLSESFYLFVLICVNLMWCVSVIVKGYWSGPLLLVTVSLWGFKARLRLMPGWWRCLTICGMFGREWQQTYLRISGYNLGSYLWRLYYSPLRLLSHVSLNWPLTMAGMPGEWLNIWISSHWRHFEEDQSATQAVRSSGNDGQWEDDVFVVTTDQGPHVTGPMLSNNVKIDRHTYTGNPHERSAENIYLLGWNFLVKLKTVCGAR